MTNLNIALTLVQVLASLIFISACIGVATTFALTILTGVTLALSFWQVTAAGFVAFATVNAINWFAGLFKT